MDKLNETLYGFINIKTLKEHIYIFDLDHTLVKPNNGIFPKDENDWCILYDSFAKIKQINGTIIIITNFKSKNIIPTQNINRVNSILAKLNVDACFMPISNDQYRKPETKIYELYILPLMKKDIKYNILVIGDAAGRPSDHSYSDKALAYNIHILLKYKNINYVCKFYTPEEYFLNKSEIKYNLPIPTSISNIPTDLSKIDLTLAQQMIILIGCPGSGKSTIAKELKKLKSNFIIINQDELHTKAKCLTLAKKEWKNGKSLIIDRMNNAEDRSEFADITNTDKINEESKVIYVYVNTSLYMAKHLNYYRHIVYGKPLVPNIVYNKYKSNLVLPKLYISITPNICNITDNITYNQLHIL